MTGSFGRAVFAIKAPLLIPGSVRAWRRMRQNDALSVTELSRLNARRSIDTARFAFMNSPFYREYYADHGVTLATFEEPDAFASLPLVTKQLLRENASRIPTPEANDRTASRSVTSGSTGEPLSLLRDLRAPARAYEWRLMSWWGVDPWRTVATIDRHYRTARQARAQQLLWWPARRIQLDTFGIDPDTVRVFAAEWIRARPAYLTGYVGGVVALVRFLADAGTALPPPTAVGVTAGPLLPAQRREIETNLSTRVYDHYRTSEANWIAGECDAQDGLHTFDDIKNVEILDDRGATATCEGEVIVTDFDNRVFPIVRYATGDVSRRIDAACTCGRPHRRIASITGRTIDVIALPSGKVIVGGLTGTFAGMEEFVRQFQIYQFADHDVEVRVILTSAPGARERAEERVQRLRDNVAGEAAVKMLVVEEIPPVKGKLRYVISEAAPGSPSSS